VRFKPPAPLSTRSRGSLKRGSTVRVGGRPEGSPRKSIKFGAMARDRTKLEAVLARAAELDSLADDGQIMLDDEEVSWVGAELGISRVSISRALSELNAGQSLTVDATAVLPGTRARVMSDLATYLHIRGLRSIAAGVWEQRSGWWPDLYRFLALTPVAVAVSDSGNSTRITLIAGLDRIWRVHLLIGVLGFVAAAVVTVPTLELTNMLAGVLVATLFMVLSWWFYLRRRRMITWRLQWALEEIARPSYRMQPW